MSKFQMFLEEIQDKAYTKEELAKELDIDPSEIKLNKVKGKMDLWMVNGKYYKKA